MTSASDLGATLLGEQVLLGLNALSTWADPDGAGQDALERATSALRALRDAGVETVVDTTPIGVGRDVGLLARASEDSGARILFSVGVKALADGLAAELRSLTATQLADVFVRELFDVVPQRAARASLVAIACDDDPDEWAETVVLAAAFAHAETGAAVTIGPGATAEWYAGRLVARGVDPQRIVVGGLDAGEGSLAAIDRLARAGVGLGFTALALPGALDDAGRATLVAYALRRHGADRVCLGTGLCAAPALAALRHCATDLNVSPEQIADILARGPRRLLGAGAVA